MKTFRWVEDARENFNIKNKYTADGFLEMLINTRYVILQDCTVLISKHNMSHFIIMHIVTVSPDAIMICYKLWEI